MLVTLGLEQGTYHIRIFRALSVLKTARSLGVTNGTAVSDILFLILLRTFLMLPIQMIMHSHKIPHSLLTNVVYFINFVMVLFS